MHPVIKTLLIGFLIWFASCNSYKEQKLTIAAAANTQFAMKEICKDFEDETGIAINLIIGSSGKLSTQILQGAPFDIFISADSKYPMKLFDEGKTFETPKIYAYGSLVLWFLKSESNPSISMLSDQFINKIAIANPKTAPYGLAAMEVINRLDNNEIIKQKLVFGESISQVNHFVNSGAADIGITARATLIAEITEGKWIELPDSLYSPIEQSIVIIDHKKKLSSAPSLFYQYLFSTKGKAVLKKYGYKIPE